MPHIQQPSVKPRGFSLYLIMITELDQGNINRHELMYPSSFRKLSSGLKFLPKWDRSTLTYFSLVRPLLKYPSSMWVPHTTSDILKNRNGQTSSRHIWHWQLYCKTSVTVSIILQKITGPLWNIDAKNQVWLPFFFFCFVLFSLLFFCFLFFCFVLFSFLFFSFLFFLVKTNNQRNERHDGRERQLWNRYQKMQCDYLHDLHDIQSKFRNIQK